MPVSQIESHDKSPLFLNIIQIASCMQSIDVYGMEHEISGLRNHYFDSLLFRQRMPTLSRLGFRQAHARSFPAWILSGACPLFPALDADGDYAACGCIVSIRIQKLLRTAAGSEDKKKQANKVHDFMLG